MDQSATLKTEFLWALTTMRDPANFKLAADLYQHADVDPKDLLRVQDWIANTTDPRAVPLLSSALQSKDRWIASDAASKLACIYPSTTVDSVFTHIYTQLPEDTRPMVAHYLQSRGLHLPPNAKPISQTPFQKALEAEKQGRTKEAANLYVSILESKESDGYVVRSSALNALKHGDAAIRSRILKARGNWLNKDAATANYLEAIDTASILRQLHSPDCLPGLSSLISHREFIFGKANRTATMAIAELGTDARKKAADALLAEMTGPLAASNDQDAQLHLLLPFAWLKDQATEKRASQFVMSHPNWSPAWQIVQPLMALPSRADEAPLLIRVIQQRPLNNQIMEWAIYRLGDLRDPRAAQALIELFKNPFASPLLLSEALESIGGPEIASQMQRIAEDATSTQRGAAVGVLANVQREKSLPFMRKLLKAGNLDAKVQALSAIGRFGTCDDWELLKPMADYWTGDRDVHYWVLQAMIAIQERLKCPKEPD